jgi:hypothetical protein
MAEDEIDPIESSEESNQDSTNPFDNKKVDEKIVPVAGLYENWFLDYASYVIMDVPFRRFMMD